MKYARVVLFIPALLFPLLSGGCEDEEAGACTSTTCLPGNDGSSGSADGGTTDGSLAFMDATTRADTSAPGDAITMACTTGPVPLDITGSQFHSVAVRPDGTVWAKGRYDFGQLGDGTPPAESSSPQLIKKLPVQVVGLSGIKSVATNADTTFAIDGGGKLYAWGGASLLGNGGLMNIGAPVETDITNVAEVVVCNGFVIARKNDGTVWAWGENLSGQIDGTGTNRRLPTKVAGIVGATAIACGGSHSLALLSDKTVYAWGGNGYGQLGNNSSGSLFGAGTPGVVMNLNEVVAIAARGEASIALKSDGTVWSWGNNFVESLYVGDAAAKILLPTRVPMLVNVKSIAAFGTGILALALTETGAVYQWGFGVPVTRIPELTGVTRIVSTGTGGYAFLGTRVLCGWGGNGWGQIDPGNAAITLETPASVVGQWP